MSSQRGRWRPPKKVNSSPGLSSAYDETATLLGRASSTGTVTLLEDTKFINEAASIKVIHTPLRRNKVIDVEKHGLCLNSLIDKTTRFESHISFFIKMH